MRIVFRTEGNHVQGMGDLVGSLALAAECAAQRDEILFVLSGGDEAIAAIKERGYGLQVADSLEAEQGILRSFRPDIVLVNQLNNDPAYIESLKGVAGFVVTVDDAGEGAKKADLNINALYPIPGAITAPEYIALRREFQMKHEAARPIKAVVEELLITQGGSDTYGFTPRIIQALEKMAARPHCTVVLGPAFRHDRELEEALKASTLDLAIIRNVRNMAEVMWNADLAITAGGLTMFELACVGTPSLVVCGERFEVPTATRLERSGTVVNLGFGGELDYDLVPKAVDRLATDQENRSRMSVRGKELVDGRGCERIVRLIRERVTTLGACRS